MFEVFRYLPALGTFFLLFCIFLPENSIIARGLAFYPLQYVGLISYEWFLFHAPPVQFMTSMIGNANGSAIDYASRTLLPFFITLGFSVIIYHFVSKPVLDYSKAKYQRRKT